MSGFFFKLGRALGHKAGPVYLKFKWIWNGLTGTEAERLRAETAFGSALVVKLHTIMESVNEPTVVTLVRDVCQRLTARVRDQRLTFHCEITRDDCPNAMALPGGFLFVSHSLVNLCESRPEELAFVIGHEMAHVIRGHAWDRSLNETAFRVASVVTTCAVPSSEWLRQQGMILLQSAHSQDCELEADALGLRLAAAAGFAPDGAIVLLQRIKRLLPNSTELGQYFGSHPPASERIARLEPLVQQLSRGSANGAHKTS